MGYDINNPTDRQNIQKEYRLNDEDMNILVNCMQVEQGKRSR